MTIKLLKIPTATDAVTKLLEQVKLLNLTNAVIIFEDNEEAVTMMNSGMQCDRINWMLDRAKIMLHENADA